MFKTMRLAAEFVNTEAVAVSSGTKGIEELLKVVDGDGVFRGGRGMDSNHQRREVMRRRSKCKVSLLFC